MTGRKKFSDQTTRIGIRIPAELYEEVQKMAVENEMTATDLIRRFFKMGLVLCSPKIRVFVQDETGEMRELIIM